jgi:LacI family transcriptional regulator
LRVKISDIARLAKVSTGTVDRVIHKRGEVSEQTRKKVEKILRDFNYQPDILARTLASKRSWIFSVLMPVSANGNDFWSVPVKGIEKALSEIGAYGITIKYYLFNQLERESFAAKAFDLLSDNPDAVLLAPVFAEDSVKFIHECKLKKIHITLFNSFIEDIEGIPYIGQNSYQSGMVAAKLLSYGIHEPGDILIINLAARKHFNHIIKREKGFRDFFDSKTSSVHNFTLHTIDSNHASDETIRNKLNEAFTNLHVKGIFVTNSRVYKVAGFIENKNFENIKLIGFDLLPVNIEYLKKGTIDFLISQRPEEQAYKGIIQIFNDLLFNRIPETLQFMPVDIITKENIENYEYR